MDAGMVEDTPVSDFIFAHGDLDHALTDMDCFHRQIREFQLRPLLPSEVCENAQGLSS
jgi:hypothetical protein